MKNQSKFHQDQAKKSPLIVFEEVSRVIFIILLYIYIHVYQIHITNINDY